MGSKIGLKLKYIECVFFWNSFNICIHLTYLLYNFPTAVFSKLIREVREK